MISIANRFTCSKLAGKLFEDRPVFAGAEFTSLINGDSPINGTRTSRGYISSSNWPTYLEHGHRMKLDIETFDIFCSQQPHHNVIPSLVLHILIFITGVIGHVSLLYYLHNRHIKYDPL